MPLTHKALSRWICGFDFVFAITLFGYQFSFSFYLTEWHLMADHQEGLGYLLCVGPIALDILDATKYTPPVDSAIAPLKFELFKQEKLAATYCVELDQTKKALEQETVRLANCGVASIGAGDAPDPLNYDYSAAYESTYLLYKKYKQALRVIEDLKRGRGRYKSIAEKKEGKNVKNKSLSTRKSRRKS